MSPANSIMKPTIFQQNAEINVKRVTNAHLECVWIGRFLPNPAFAFFQNVFFFFFTRFEAFWVLRLLFMHCSMNSSRKLWLFKFFWPITAHRVLFSVPLISLFSNFFSKNGSHDTIQTFKNYFATVFFSFQFQFSVFSCIQTDP